MTSLSTASIRTRTILLAGAAALTGCSDGPTEPTPRVLATLVVSDPSAAVASAPPSERMSLTTTSDMVFVSLPPGTILDGMAAVIRNLRTGLATNRPFSDGGFDPVPIAAAVGDQIEIRITRAGGLEESFRYTVPVRRPPRIVRTIPPRGKGDVPVNSVVTIVFSEPVDEGTLTSTSVRLFQGTTVVPGQLEFAGSDRLSVSFEPAASLMPNTSYRIEVGAVRDADGDVLEQPSSIEFTTGEGPLAGQVAYIGSAPGGWALHVMSAPGTLGSRIAGVGSAFCCSGKPAWSPDGSRIAFVHDEWEVTAPEIRIVNVDGSALTTLTDGVTPAWSPAGDRIAFSGLVGADFVLFTVNVDGSNRVQLTSVDAEFTGYDMWPSWSPDGSEIAFSRHRQKADPNDGEVRAEWSGLFVVRADGSGLRRLPVSGTPWEPTWSPDGRRIAFAAGGAISLVDVDGTNPNTLGRPANAEDQSPSWSPEGDRILFRRTLWSEVNGQQIGSGNIWVMNVNGSNQRQLTSSHLYLPSWSPVAPTP